MMRSALEQQRENAWCCESRIPHLASAIKPLGVRRAAGLTRETVGVSTWNNNTSTAELIATATLQAYLRSDIDARSGRSLLHPLSFEKEMPNQSAIGRYTKVEGTGDKQQTESQPTRDRKVIDRTANATATANGERASSPLSRFLKQASRHLPPAPTLASIVSECQSRLPNQANVRQQVSRPTSDTGLPAKGLDLNRSLLEKIDEAKSLRQLGAVRNNRASPRDCPKCFDQTTPRRDRSEDSNAVGDSSVVAENPPPLPQPTAKPVMPVIQFLPTAAIGASSSKHLALEKQQHNKHEDSSPQLSSVERDSSWADDLVKATNAVMAIQRTWRRRRDRYHQTNRQQNSDVMQVQLIVDKRCEAENIAPLFARPPVKRSQNPECKLLKQSQTSLCGASKVDDGQVDTAQANYRPSIDPWMDHELVFMEEGRHVGELTEAVRSGNVVDEDELIWKRPQIIIQQRETQRVSALRKTRRRNIPKSRIERQDAFCIDDQAATHNDKVTTVAGQRLERSFPSLPQLSGIRKRSRKREVIRGVRDRKRKWARTVLRVQGAAITRKKHSSVTPDERCAAATDVAEGEVAVQNGEPDPSLGNRTGASNDPSRGMPNDFQIFSDVISSGGLINADENRLRNDLISVGDLTVGGKLRFHQHEGMKAEKTMQQQKDSISLSKLILAGSEREETIPTIPGSLLNDEAVSATKAANAAVQFGDGGDDDVDYDPDKLRESKFREGSAIDLLTSGYPGSSSSDDDDDQDALYERPWGPLENLYRRVSGDSSASPSPSIAPSDEESQCSSESGADEDPIQSPRNDPLLALEAMKGAVAETMTQILKLRSEAVEEAAKVSPPRDQQIELSASTTETYTPCKPMNRPRLDDDQRLEFLRVLSDFKRCLRPSTANASPSIRSIPSPSTTPSRQSSYWSSSDGDQSPKLHL